MATNIYRKIKDLPGSESLRHGRVSEPGRPYLVTTVTVERTSFFSDPINGRIVAREIARLDHGGYIQFLAFVVMPDHLHWLFVLGDKLSLSEVVAYLKGRSAHELNHHLQREGAVWQKSFHDHALRKDEDIKQIARYLVANPLRAGLVEKLNDYPLWDAIWVVPDRG